MRTEGFCTCLMISHLYCFTIKKKVKSARLKQPQMSALELGIIAPLPWGAAVSELCVFCTI